VENIYIVLCFAANLFVKLLTKFHQNRSGFVEITKKTFWSFFPRRSVYVTYILCWFYKSNKSDHI